MLTGIAIETVSNVVKISSINYNTNVITLSSSMTWADNAPIWLYKKSDGVRVLYGIDADMGAHEFIQTGPVDTIPPAAPSGLTVN